MCVSMRGGEYCFRWRMGWKVYGNGCVDGIIISTIDLKCLPIVVGASALCDIDVVFVWHLALFARRCPLNT